MMKHVTPGNVSADASARSAMRTELERSGTPPQALSFRRAVSPATPRLCGASELGAAQIPAVLRAHADHFPAKGTHPCPIS